MPSEGATPTEVEGIVRRLLDFQHHRACHDLCLVALLVIVCTVALGLELWWLL